MEVNLALVHSGSTPMQICVVLLPLVIHSFIHSFIIVFISSQITEYKVIGL